MADMEKIKRHFRHIWDCEVIHPIFSDKVCEIVEKTVEMVEQERRWIPVSEWFPRHGTSILAICEDRHGNANGMVVEWISENGVWHPLPFEYISHWMPLPQPPKEGEHG